MPTFKQSRQRHAENSYLGGKEVQGQLFLSQHCCCKYLHTCMRLSIGDTRLLFGDICQCPQQDYDQDRLSPPPMALPTTCEARPHPTEVLLGCSFSKPVTGVKCLDKVFLFLAWRKITRRYCNTFFTFALHRSPLPLAFLRACSKCVRKGNKKKSLNCRQLSNRHSQLTERA